MCVRFENVVARRWIALESGDQADLQVTPVRRPSSADGVTNVTVEIGDGRGESHFTAIVRYAPSYPSAPVMPSATRDSGSPWDRERVYRRAMFHGPLFQGIERVTHLDMTARMRCSKSSAEADCCRGGAAFAVDPVLLDQPGQVFVCGPPIGCREGSSFSNAARTTRPVSPALPAGSRLAFPRAFAWSARLA